LDYIPRDFVHVRSFVKVVVVASMLQ
jgi:hypothetical protein